MRFASPRGRAAAAGPPRGNCRTDAECQKRSRRSRPWRSRCTSPLRPCRAEQRDGRHGPREQDTPDLLVGGGCRRAARGTGLHRKARSRSDPGFSPVSGPSPEAASTTVYRRCRNQVERGALGIALRFSVRHPAAWKPGMLSMAPSDPKGGSDQLRMMGRLLRPGGRGLSLQDHRPAGTWDDPAGEGGRWPAGRRAA